MTRSMRCRLSLVATSTLLTTEVPNPVPTVFSLFSDEVEISADGDEIVLRTDGVYNGTLAFDINQLIQDVRTLRGTPTDRDQRRGSNDQKRFALAF